MNSRERFLAVLHGEKPDRPPLFEEGIRDEVLAGWRAQGLPQGVDLESLFEYDHFEQIDADVYPRPAVTDWSDPGGALSALRERLDPDDRRRLPGNWPERVKGWRDRQHPLFLRIHQGLLLSLGIEDWRSFAPALLRLVDQPELVHEVMGIQAEFAARLGEKILGEVDLDGIVFSEPIAGNHGAVISAAMYRDFALQSYAPVFEVARRHRVPAVIWRSYANPASLIAEVVKFPFNALWLCETPPAELGPAQVRQLAGPQVTLIGGIDADVLFESRPTIRRAVAAVLPFVEQGHFIPLADGRVREEAPYPNYAFYRQQLQRLIRNAYA